MMIRLPLYVLAVFFVLSVGCSRAFDYPEAKVTMKIIDEDGKPIEAANASITFELPKRNGEGIYSEKGVTRADGVFSASGRTAINIAYGAEKQGYYESFGEYHFT